MLDIDKNLQPVILFYILLCIILYHNKPDLMFREDGSLKPFGTGKGKTIAPFWLIALLGGIIFYIYMNVTRDKFVPN